MQRINRRLMMVLVIGAGVIPACFPTFNYRKPFVVPSSVVNVQLDPAKLDTNNKYAQDGLLRISGLFQRDGQFRDVLVKVTVYKPEGKVLRRYEFVPTEDSLGAKADFAMFDGGMATFTFPTKAGVWEPGLRFSQRSTWHKAMASPRGGLMLCYLGAGIYFGGLQFAVCDQGQDHYIGFVDAEQRVADK
jgi:hypothetical protein